jgi:hypothetical protein
VAHVSRHGDRGEGRGGRSKITRENRKPEWMGAQRGSGALLLLWPMATAVPSPLRASLGFVPEGRRQVFVLGLGGAEMARKGQDLELTWPNRTPIPGLS